MAVAVDGCGTRFKVVFIGLSLDVRDKKRVRRRRIGGGTPNHMLCQYIRGQSSMALCAAG
jgi:hypothetical protein